MDQDVLEMARGLIDSRVVVKRPPSAAQRRAYHAAPKGPPLAMAPKEKRPFSAKARITSHEESDFMRKSSASALPPRPPWKPFTRVSSLSKMEVQGYLHADILKSEDLSKEKDGNSEDDNVSSIYQNRVLPQGLMALSEWLTEEVPSGWAQGYSPESSFVFLPCLQSTKEDLPCVPMPQEPEDQLVYTPPPPQPQKYKPPRPRTKKNTDSKGEPAPQPKSADNSDDESRVNHMRMYTNEGELLHDIYRGKRGADLIRQEIRDLERLLQGIGNPEGSSIVVRYQYDINHLQDMVKSTLKDYVFPEEVRPQTPMAAAAALQEDLIKYPARHDAVMTSIRKRRDECVEELAAIEERILHGKT